MAVLPLHEKQIPTKIDRHARSETPCAGATDAPGRGGGAGSRWGHKHPPQELLTPAPEGRAPDEREKAKTHRWRWRWPRAATLRRLNEWSHAGGYCAKRAAGRARCGQKREKRLSKCPILFGCLFCFVARVRRRGVSGDKTIVFIKYVRFPKWIAVRMRARSRSWKKLQNWQLLDVNECARSIRCCV